MSIESKSLHSPDEIRTFDMGKLQITRHGGFRPRLYVSLSVKGADSRPRCAQTLGYELSPPSPLGHTGR